MACTTGQEYAHIVSGMHPQTTWLVFVSANDFNQTGEHRRRLCLNSIFQDLEMLAFDIKCTVLEMHLRPNDTMHHSVILFISLSKYIQA